MGFILSQSRFFINKQPVTLYLPSDMSLVVTIIESVRKMYHRAHKHEMVAGHPLIWLAGRRFSGSDITLHNHYLPSGVPIAPPESLLET